MLKKSILVSVAVATLGGGVLMAPASAAQKANVAIGLDSKSVSTSYIAAQIRTQAEKQGVRLSDREVQTAAQSATDKLGANDQGPQKGIIHLKGKKFAICISWGADKDHC